jgi:hypothetical protein
MLMDAWAGKEDGDLLPSSGMVVSPAANLAKAETDTGGVLANGSKAASFLREIQKKRMRTLQEAPPPRTLQISCIGSEKCV